jgi:hypothetical protein
MAIFYGFLKFGQREHMEALHYKGELHFESQEFFRKLKGHPGRGDLNEGLLRHYGPKVSRITVRCEGEEFPFSPGSGPLKVWRPKGRMPHICSLFGIKKKPIPGILTVAEEWIGFGEAFVAITDTDEFVRRVEKAVESTPWGLSHGPVEYVPQDSYAGEMNAFMKVDDFEYQSEFRIAINLGSPTAEPFNLQIGSLEDISVIGEASGFTLSAPTPAPCHSTAADA